MSRYFLQVYLNHFHIKGAGVAGLQWAWLWYRHQAASGLSLSLFLVWSTKENDLKFSLTRFIGFRSLRWKASDIGTTRTGELILHLYHHNWSLSCFPKNIFPYFLFLGCFCENVFNRNLDLGSLEKNVENQPKFFANSMKVPFFLSQYKTLLFLILCNKCQHVESLPCPRFIKTHHPISMLPPDLLNKAKVDIFATLDISFRWYTWAAMLRIFACLHSTMRGLMLRFQSKQFFKKSAPYILCSRWAQAFKEGEVMIGNWFEHMKEVKKDEQWLLVMFFFSSLSAMRHFRRILLWCIILRWIALTL